MNTEQFTKAQRVKKDIEFWQTMLAHHEATLQEAKGIPLMYTQCEIEKGYPEIAIAGQLARFEKVEPLIRKKIADLTAEFDAI